MGFFFKLAEAVRVAFVDVHGQTGHARHTYTEKVLHAPNMLRRVCVLPKTYGDSTHHVRNPIFLVGFLHVDNTHLHAWRGCDRGLSLLQCLSELACVRK